MSKHIEFTTKTGTYSGELAEPEGTAKAGAVVVVHEWHGLSDEMRAKINRFAREGFIVLAPDLHHGKVATNDEEAKKLMSVFDFARAVGEIGSALEWIKKQPRSNGKVGVVGFSLGGALTFATSAAVPGISCAIPFYGVLETSRLDLDKVTAPIQAHFAPHDDWANPDRARQIQEALEARGKSMDLHIYEGAGHSFMREGDKTTYHETSAKKAWERALSFLHKHLG
jgi:carboxymethylenebutenolidase